MASKAALMRIFDARLKRVELLTEAIAEEMGIEVAEAKKPSGPPPRDVLKGFAKPDVEETPPAPMATEAARELAEEYGIDLAEVEGTGEGGNILKGDVAKAIS